jgi:hypothetical protein
MIRGMMKNVKGFMSDHLGKEVYVYGDCSKVV